MSAINILCVFALLENYSCFVDYCLKIHVCSSFELQIFTYIVGRVMCKKLGLSIKSSITLVICPLNIIQKDQLVRLKRHNITCCKLDTKGHGSFLDSAAMSDSDEETDTVEKVANFCFMYKSRTSLGYKCTREANNERGL